MLDGMRAVAIVLGCCSTSEVLFTGNTCVDFFLGLSGFLISALLYEEWERSGAISFGAFYERRVRRLVPALLVLIAAVAILSLAGARRDGWANGYWSGVWPLGSRVLATLGFATNWVSALGHNDSLGTFGITWTNSNQEQFYILLPPVLWLLLRGGAGPHRIVGLLTATCLLLIGADSLVYANVPGWNLYFSPLSRTAEILFGVIAATAWHYRMVPRGPARWTATPVALRPPLRWAARHSGAALRWSLILALLVLLWAPGLSFRERYLSVGLATVLLIVNLIDGPASVPARLLSCRPMVALGRVSYAMYLFKLQVRNGVVEVLPHASRGVVFVITFLVTLGLGAASYRFVERPVIAAGRRRMGAARPDPAPPPDGPEAAALPPARWEVAASPLRVGA